MTKLAHGILLTVNIKTLWLMSVSFLKKINEPFRYENASNLRQFFHDNLNKNKIIKYFLLKLS